MNQLQWQLDKSITPQTAENLNWLRVDILLFAWIFCCSREYFVVRVDILWFAWMLCGSRECYVVRVNIKWFAWILSGSREYFVVRVDIWWFAWMLCGSRKYYAIIIWAVPGLQARWKIQKYFLTQLFSTHHKPHCVVVIDTITLHQHQHDTTQKTLCVSDWHNHIASTSTWHNTITLHQHQHDTTRKTLCSSDLQKYMSN